MKLCVRCKKRPAMVFLSQSGISDSNAVGYCIQCAKEMGVKPVTDMLEQFNINDDQLEAMNDEFKNFMEQIEQNDGEEASENFLPSTLFSIADDMDEDEQSHLTTVFKRDNAEDDEQDGSDKKERKRKKKKRKELNAYCTDLTGKAANGEIDRVIGRDREIERIIQILSRRSKNNPCLIGEPGVGKTAIAEGLAIRIINGDVPARLADKEIFLLDLTALVAGTQFRGQFESRIKNLLKEIKADGNIIVFIDEIHTLVGTGDNEGTMSAANILKPALSRGEIQVIGATTFKEYRKYIEKDSALERRFQPVVVNEPTVDDTVKILDGIKEYYEQHHHVKMSNYITRRAIVLSERYITDRFLPDKAIDLLDEAGACASLRNIALSEYDNLNRELAKKNTELDSLISEAELAEEPDFEKQAILRAEISRIDEKIKELEPEAKKASVNEDDLAKVIELWTGIPASKIAENENKKLLSLENRLNKRVIGQKKATNLVAAAICRSRVQVSPRRHPASFIFVGPTGVGKTELVKVLADELFDSTETFIRLDMSEYMEKHSVSKIIGSPPGYVGYDEAGQLTEKVRRKPYSVILFDEIEKAHPDVLNILLQILDEGIIKDSQGRTVNFENCIIVMTSNAGSDKKGTALGFAKTEQDLTNEKVMKALSAFLRPEFLARIDEVVVFDMLTKEDFKEIAKIMIDEYVTSLSERSIELIFEDNVLTWLADKSFGGKSAARDLRNLIRREVEDKIAMLLISWNEEQPKKITVSVNKENENQLSVTGEK